MIWLEEAARHIGMAEVPGEGANPDIMALFHRAGLDWIKDDGEQGWCGVFLAPCMLAAGHEPPPRYERAVSWARWGEACDLKRGAVVVFRWADGSHHVGLVWQWDGQRLYVLGGNQGDAVAITAYRSDRVIACRWPAGAAEPRPVAVADMAPGQSRTNDMAKLLQTASGWLAMLTGVGTAASSALPLASPAVGPAPAPLPLPTDDIEAMSTLGRAVLGFGRVMVDLGGFAAQHALLALCLVGGVTWWAAWRIRGYRAETEQRLKESRLP